MFLPQTKECDRVREDVNVVRVLGDACAILVYHACCPNRVEIIHCNISTATLDAEDALLTARSILVKSACYDDSQHGRAQFLRGVSGRG